MTDLTKPRRSLLSDEELRFLYGNDATISRSDDFVFVHLDKPTPELCETRTSTFSPDEYFSCDCRICQITKEGGVIVFDDRSYVDDVVVLL